MGPSQILLIITAVLSATANAGLLPDGRITGGAAAGIHQAPYTAALLVDSAGNGAFAHVCGAVIVSTKSVITSATCTRFSAARTRVRVGTPFHNSGGAVMQVSSIKKHESFNKPTNMNNDIAVLSLTRAIVLNGTSAGIAPLPIQGLTLGDGTNCEHYGWGRLSAQGIFPNNLQRVSLPVLNTVVCKSLYTQYNTVTDTMMCAGRLEVMNIGPCQGDVGGPLTCNGVVHGILSWNRGCGEANSPAVFTKLSLYSNWLKDKIIE